MATTFVEVLLQLRNELGTDVLSGGKIYTYEAGTTTPLATYQDSEGSVANTNPVILDSAGMAEIRQTDGVAYKWYVTDADDNELWTRDDITVGDASAGSADDVLVTLNFVGSPGAQSFMGGAIFDRDVLFPIDFEGADGHVGTNPGSDYVISIRKNDTEVGTATVDTLGAFTFATISGVTVPFSAGDYITFVAPDSGTAADIIGSLTGATTRRSFSPVVK